MEQYETHVAKSKIWISDMWHKLRDQTFHWQSEIKDEQRECNKGDTEKDTNKRGRKAEKPACLVHILYHIF